jgi:hypothetical protein
MAHASGNIPVDSADIVAGLILAHFLKGDAGALENAVVFPAQQVFDGAASPQLQSPNLA